MEYGTRLLDRLARETRQQIRRRLEDALVGYYDGALPPALYAMLDDYVDSRAITTRCIACRVGVYVGSEAALERLTRLVEENLDRFESALRCTADHGTRVAIDVTELAVDGALTGGRLALEKALDAVVGSAGLGPAALVVTAPVDTLLEAGTDAASDLVMHIAERGMESVVSRIVDAVVTGVRARAHEKLGPPGRVVDVVEVICNRLGACSTDRVEIDASEFANPDWDAATACVRKDSGRGGVDIFTFPHGKLVVKSSAGLTSLEVFASRLARAIGLTAPETRVAGDGEGGRIEDRVRALGKSLKGGRPYMVMRYLDAVDIGELTDHVHDLRPDDVRKLVVSAGRWMAYDMLIGEIDRSSSNLMVNPADLDGGIAGIDQTVMSRREGGAAQREAVGEMLWGVNAANTVLTQWVRVEGDAEDYMDDVTTAALAGLDAIAELLTPERIDELAHGLAIPRKTLDSLKAFTATCGR